jgi:predicted MFS family arabinose efflux permease
VITALVAGVVLLGAFVRWQVQTPTPMLPPQLFRSRAFTGGNAAIFLTFASLFTGVFFFAQLLQVVLGHDALGAGLRLLPWTATFITVAPAAGALADRIGERLLLSVGLALQAAGFLWLVAVADPGLTYGQLIGPFVLAGVGVSMAIPCAQNAVVGGVDSDSIGAAAGVNSMMRELGGVFGIAVTVAVFASSGDYGSVLGFLDGFRPAIVTAAGFALVGAVCGVAVPARQRHGMVQPDLALAS